MSFYEDRNSLESKYARAKERIKELIAIANKLAEYIKEDIALHEIQDDLFEEVLKEARELVDSFEKYKDSLIYNE